MQYGHQWRLCDNVGAGCGDIAGERVATHAVTAAELNKTLRVLVTAFTACSS